MVEKPPEVVVIGAGVAGLVTAVALAERGATVRLVERGPKPGSGASWMAGGMLAPWCEAESAPEEVTIRSLTSLDWWASHVPNVQRNGTLVVAPARDQAEISRFARRTRHFEWVAQGDIERLEPLLGQRFSRGLFFPTEGHLDPRKALLSLREKFVSLGGVFEPLCEADGRSVDAQWVVDCSGFAGRDNLEGLRGVRGEMVLLHSPEVKLSRPVRMLHPRIPIYIVPRENGVFMVGATMIESSDPGGITLRSMTELLNAAYVLHPAFADAEILESGVGLRPSFSDNMPRVSRHGNRIYVNGMYRHGFLLSPSCAEAVVNIVYPT